MTVTRGDHNTDYITEKVRKKIWILRGMKNSGLTVPQLVDAYIKEVRSILELAVPVWGSGITVEQSLKIMIPKAALARIDGSKFESYEHLLQNTICPGYLHGENKYVKSLLRKTLK